MCRCVYAHEHTRVHVRCCRCVCGRCWRQVCIHHNKVETYTNICVYANIFVHARACNTPNRSCWNVEKTRANFAISSWRWMPLHPRKVFFLRICMSSLPHTDCVSQLHPTRMCMWSCAFGVLCFSSYICSREDPLECAHADSASSIIAKSPHLWDNKWWCLEIMLFTMVPVNMCMYMHVCVYVRMFVCVCPCVCVLPLK